MTDEIVNVCVAVLAMVSELLHPYSVPIGCASQLYDNHLFTIFQPFCCPQVAKKIVIAALKMSENIY